MGVAPGDLATTQGMADAGRCDQRQGRDPQGVGLRGRAMRWDDDPADFTPLDRYRIAYGQASDLADFLRQLALPRPVRTWTLTTLREKLIKVGAKVVHHARAVTFQLAEVAVPRASFAAILVR